MMSNCDRFLIRHIVVGTGNVRGFRNSGPVVLQNKVLSGRMSGFILDMSSTKVFLTFLFLEISRTVKNI